jgi:hypothetical protein
MEMEKEVAIVDVLAAIEIKNISMDNNDQKVILFHG